MSDRSANAFFERSARSSDVDPDASSLTGRGPRQAPYAAAREADVAERVSDLLVSRGIPRWQADKIGALAPWTPPGQAFSGGHDIGRGINEGDPWQALGGFAQVGMAAAPLIDRAPARAPTAAPRGPWTPGYMDEWLESRPSPVPRHELNRQPAGRLPQADRRWGEVKPDMYDVLVKGL